MNTIAKLNSYADSITHQQRSKDIRMTCAKLYSYGFSNFGSLEPTEMNHLTYRFGIHLHDFLQVAANRALSYEFRESVLTDALGRSLDHLTLAASEQEEERLRQSDPHNAFTSAVSLSVQEAVENWVDFADAQAQLLRITAMSKDNVKVINAAKRLSDQIGTSCTQFFPDALNPFDSRNLQPPRSSGMSRSL